MNYIIQVSNPSGPSTIDAVVTDTLPAGLTGGTWACVSFGGAVCANGYGNTLTDTATLPIGSAVAYIYTATVVDSGANDQLSNTASVAPVAGSSDPAGGNNSATDTDTVHIFIDGFEGTPLTRPMPRRALPGWSQWCATGSHRLSASIRSAMCRCSAR